MPTQILRTGTQIINSGTQIITKSPTVNTENFTGGLLQKNEIISGWSVIDKINVQSGEADLYIVTKDDRKAVLKYYRGNIHPKKELLEKLIGLKHPDIISIYEFGEYKNHFYEIMEYAKGGALNSKKEDGSYKYLPLSEENAIQVCKEVIESFKTCHEKGIIHRDIKPANIYYRNVDGTDVVIGDFGISSILSEEEILTHKTNTSSRTTGYAAPEVLSNFISPKADYYSLGITLWEILTGNDPFVMENGKQRNDAHLMRDTIEGRIVDDLLSREPQLSDSIQHLIRGLLVIDPEKRWGYDEITKHLKGEYVEVAEKEVSTWTFKIAGINCSSLEEIGNALSSNIDSEDVKKTVYRGFVSSFLEDKYPEVAKKISEITEENSAAGTLKLGIYEICWILNPNIPFVTKNGYKAENIEDILNLLQNAPEEMVSELKNKDTVFYKYLNHLGYNDKISKIKEIAEKINDASGFEKLLYLSKIILILKDYIIKPFNFGKFKDLKLSEIEQLHSLPEELLEYIGNLISQKSLEGHLYTWLLDKIEAPKMKPIKSLADFKTYISEANTWISSNKTKTKDLSDEQEKKYLEAEKAFFDKGNINEPLQAIKEIFAYDEYNQKTLFLYLCLLNNHWKKNELNKIISSINYESLGYNLFMILYFINVDDFAKASILIKKSLLLWPNSFLLQCLNILSLIKRYTKSKNQTLLEVAEKKINSLGYAQNQLELSWQVKLLHVLSIIKGNEPIKFDKKLCEEKSLYYKFMSSNDFKLVY